MRWFGCLLNICGIVFIELRLLPKFMSKEWCTLPETQKTLANLSQHWKWGWRPCRCGRWPAPWGGQSWLSLSHKRWLPRSILWLWWVFAETVILTWSLKTGLHYLDRMNVRNEGNIPVRRYSSHVGKTGVKEENKQEDTIQQGEEG